MTVPPPLADRVIVVIGGTSGLGRSAAEACRRAGAAVVVTGRDAAKCKAIESGGDGDLRAVAADATDPAAADLAIRAAIDSFGGLDGIYHVAGGSGRAAGDGPVGEITDEGWETTIQWNLTSLFYSNRAAVRYFVDQARPGSILNMTSVLAWSPAPRFFATHAYAAAKAAVIGLTRTAAAHYAPNGIRFNALAPALVETPMATRATADPEIMRYVASKQPLGGGRIGTPDDLDAAVVYFLSDESRFTTGQVLAVDGGWELTDGQYHGDPLDPRE